jgi:hypothetical protein
MSVLHQAIASDIAPLGGILKCLTCGKNFPLAEARVANSLANGWPKCCGYTMRWITARELAKGEK